MSLYRHQITFLLEKYNTLEAIIDSHKGTRKELEEVTKSNVEEIEAYKSEIELDTIHQKYPKIIEDSLNGIQQISNAINDIKIFVAINDEDLKKTDINRLLSAIAGQQSYEDKKIDLQLDLQQLPLVNLPEKNLTKAIQAVVDNALKAVKTHGIISISSRHEEPHILIIVSDLGTGISDESLTHIFVPYFTGWDKGDKGLGLSFAKSVLLSCGGDIKVRSTVNEGTTVTLYLPSQPHSPES